jgi:signal peptidase I
MVMTSLGSTATQDSLFDPSLLIDDPTSTLEVSPVNGRASAGSTGKQRPRHKRTPGSRLRAVGLFIKRSLIMVLVLAILGAAGIGAWALAQGSWSVNPVLSGSMRPGFTVGGVVISQRIPVSQLAVRDVIVFHNPNKPSEEMVHRIVQMTKGPNGELFIKTQGDANPVRDPWTLTIRGNSVYKVRWSLPLLGYVAVAYQNHRGIALMVAGFLLILVALSIVIRQRREAKAPPASVATSEPAIE